MLVEALSLKCLNFHKRSTTQFLISEVFASSSIKKMKIYSRSLSFTLCNLMAVASALTLPLLSQNLTTLDASGSAIRLIGFKWKVHITEGIWRIEALAPSARLYNVDSTIGPYPRRVLDLQNLRQFTIISYDPDADPDRNALVIKGTIDSATQAVAWTPVVRSRWVGPVAAENLYWPPDHDVFEAAARLRSDIEYNIVEYKRAEDKNVYAFHNGWAAPSVGLIDARTLQRLQF